MSALRFMRRGFVQRAAGAAESSPLPLRRESPAGMRFQDSGEATPRYKVWIQGLVPTGTDAERKVLTMVSKVSPSSPTGLRVYV